MTLGVAPADGIGLAESLLNCVAQDCLARSGLPDAARKAEQQRQSAKAAVERLKRAEILTEYAAIVDRRLPRQLRFVGETVTFTWASHHVRNESSIKDKTKTASILRELEVQKEVVTRLLGDTVIDYQHWSAVPWMKCPTWLQEQLSFAKDPEAARCAAQLKQPSTWSDLESDSEYEDYHDTNNYHEHLYEGSVPEPERSIVKREREEFSAAVKSYYRDRFEVLSVFACGDKNIMRSPWSMSPIEGFVVRLDVRFPKTAVQRLMPHCTQRALAEAFASEPNSLLERATHGLCAAATVAMKSSRRGIWPALQQTICSFLPTPEDVGPCVRALEAHFKEQTAASNKKADALLKVIE